MSETGISKLFINLLGFIILVVGIAFFFQSCINKNNFAFIFLILVAAFLCLIGLMVLSDIRSRSIAIQVEKNNVTIEKAKEEFISQQNIIKQKLDMEKEKLEKDYRLKQLEMLLKENSKFDDNTTITILLQKLITQL